VQGFNHEYSLLFYIEHNKYAYNLDIVTRNSLGGEKGPELKTLAPLFFKNGRFRRRDKGNKEAARLYQRFTRLFQARHLPRKACCNNSRPLAGLRRPAACSHCS
jgi:hypothetical protein